MFILFICEIFLITLFFLNNNRLNGQFTLDNIASCLFGIETNSLQNENAVFINHLKKFFTVNLANLFFLVLRKCLLIFSFSIIVFFIYKIVISPRLAGYLGTKGFSLFPRDAVIYTTNIVNQILSRRRQHLERRNDFIQMMIDREEETKHEEQPDKQEKQWGTLKKSINKISLCLHSLF